MRILFGIIFCCFNFIVIAQNSSDSLTKQQFIEETHENETDIVDFIKNNRYYIGLFGEPAPRIENVKPQFAILPAAGYSLQTGFAVVMAANMQFYTNPKNLTKASGACASITYTQKDQLIIPIFLNYWSKSNRFNFSSDNRYMNYPTQNFGIGPKSIEADGYTIVYSYLKLHEMFSFQMAKNTYLGIGYFYDYFWNIKELDAPPPPPDNGPPHTLLGKYGKKDQELSSGIVLRPFYDSRPNQINPMKGALISGTFRVNPPFMGSDMPWASAIIEFRKYIRFPAASHNVIALWNYNWFTQGRAPYLLLPSTGWDDQFNTGRGYLQGRYKDKNMMYLEAEYRFRLTKNGLLGAVVFGNIQTYSRDINSKDLFIPAAGTGLRIKLNKFATTNLAIDYAWGINNSQGFFVNLGEVF